MSKLISRQEGIKWLESLRDKIGETQYQSLWHYEQAIAEIIELLSQPPADSGPDTNVGTNQWIPCSERLPNTTDNVLITTQYGVILTVFRGMSGK